MQENLLSLLRCPVSRSELQLQVISTSFKTYKGKKQEIVYEALLFGAYGWFFPVINGIPRLTVEAFIDYEAFLQKHLKDYEQRRRRLETDYQALILYAIKKNARTKKSFQQQWSVYNYETDKTWEADEAGMLERFLKETGEQVSTLPGKIIFDAGCGNGQLNEVLAEKGARILGMDLSRSVERAFERNSEPDAFFIQGDIQFPPVAFGYFDIVHSSGVLHHTNNTELSFSCIEPCVKTEGKLSVWLYQPRADKIHNVFNGIRKYTSKLPLKFQYHLYQSTLFPVSYAVKRAKRNKQNKREMMIAILDWFSPEFRWEHTTAEVQSWFYKRNYKDVVVTTTDIFGFNMIGIKQ